MTAIAGMSGNNKKQSVNQMLQKMTHRGNDWSEVVEQPQGTIGISGISSENFAQRLFLKNEIARDGLQTGWFSQAKLNKNGIALERDPIGVTPLYYGWTSEGDFCFASEVKGLLGFTRNVRELEPGSSYNEEKPYGHHYVVQRPLDDKPEIIAKELRMLLHRAVSKCARQGHIGSWLSGGLDSSILAALAIQDLPHLPTFAAGLKGASDLHYARAMADYIHSDHHEIVVTEEEIFKVLPEVIYHLESFDALLIRSSILNFIAAKKAAEFVPTVLSGEGGDELFAGYEYLKSLNLYQLAPELIDILNALHNTALQRVDRCSSAHATKAFVAFLDPEVVAYSVRIPVEYKLVNGVEKWILRQAAADILPPDILNRPKAKFWEGAGIKDYLARYSDTRISDRDFASGRWLPNGVRLNSKEEMLYYRIFEDQFGKLPNLDWVGRTKGSPVL